MTDSMAKRARQGGATARESEFVEGQGLAVRSAGLSPLHVAVLCMAKWLLELPVPTVFVWKAIRQTGANQLPKHRWENCFSQQL